MENLTRYESIPRSSIRQIVAWQHVGTPAAEVARDMAARVARGGGSPEVMDECVAFALSCHEENRQIARLA